MSVITPAPRIAPLEIHAAPDSHFLVKLTDRANNQTVITAFVRQGERATFDVPVGSFEFRYATGDQWYGDEYLFGPETGYFRADEAFEFAIQGDEIRGFTIQLYKVPDGNLHTSSIEATQF